MKINAINHKDIEALSPDQLVELLSNLLSHEVQKEYATEEIQRISIPRPITIKDGGEDARVELEIDPARIIKSLWIKQKLTVFQSKAQKMDDRACYREVIANPQVRKHKAKKAGTGLL